ncbi:hypothetical protein N0V94_005960 [Neodidymelliopsis sp. IMI 364377]|nr:hypothetical protein N0V94_005960 [Neodidymelliopsis sp. IMI 364377]
MHTNLQDPPLYNSDQSSTRNLTNMSSNQNPWQDEYSSTPTHGGGYQSPPPAQAHGVSNHNPYSAYQDQTSSSHTQYAPPNHPPPGHNPSHGSPFQGATHNEDPWAQYQSPDFNPHASPQQHQQQQQQQQPNSNAPSHQFRVPPHNSETQNFQGLNDNEYEVPPGLPPRRTNTDLALPQGQDRSHQIEVMQSYEARGMKDEHDQNVEILQREFPKLDGSLIAAIYGDSKSLSATREMLGELDRE